MSSEASAQIYRSTARRIGLVVLNIIAPGLGLIRLGRLKEGTTFLFGLFAGVAVSTWIAWISLVISPLGYLLMIAAFLLATVFVYLASTIRVWRLSRLADPARQIWQRWYALAAFYALSLLVSFGAVTFARTTYKSYYTPGASMEPTFAVGDQLIADMRGQQRITRGDVVVLEVGDDDYVKRVVAIGGDRIKLVKGVPYLNGIPSEQHIVGSYLSDNTRAARLTERLPGELRFHEILDFGPTELDDYDEQIVPEGHFFLLGDSRDNSADSRVSRSLGGIGGTASAADIRGRALFKTFDRHYRWLGKAVP